MSLPLAATDAPEVAVAPVAAPRRLPTGAIVLRALFMLYVGGLVAAPLAMLVYAGLGEGLGHVWSSVTSPAALDALRLSMVTALLAATLNGVLGLAIAWVLVRWEFPGRGLLSAVVDLPFAIPTLVAGILLVALYGPASLVGGWFEAWGLPIVFARPGIVMALLFVTLPFVVRTVEPVLRELDPAEEEAALTLGASKFTTFVRVLLPPIVPAVAAGTVQVFARSVAEFGSIAVVSGNIPYRTLTAPVYVLGEIEAGEPASAAAVSRGVRVLALVLQPLGYALGARAGGRRG